MELQQLRYVVALSHELNFQRAAKRSHVSQPTLSQQIKKLEEELGAVLFERSSHGVKLTGAGEKFLPHAVGVLDNLERGVSALQEESGEPSGKIRIAAIPTIGPYILPRVIIHLKKTAPRIALEISEETTSSLIERLKEGRFDLGLLSLPISDAGIVSRSLGKEPFYLTVAKNHPLANKKQVKMKDIRNERLLILQEGHCFGEQALEYCKRSREDDQIIFQGSSLTSIMKLAAAGNGITLVPKMAVEPFIHPGLRFIPFAPPKPEREVGMAWRISAPLTHAHRFLLKVIEEAQQTKKRG